METHLCAELVLEALDFALSQRRPGEVIHNSDQGTQYPSIQFGSRCREVGVRPSIGSVGDCFDNAMCESFFATWNANCRPAAGSRPRSRPAWQCSSSLKAGTTRIGVTPPSTICRRETTKGRITNNL